MQAEPAIWDSAEVDWDSYDLVVLRSPWDYLPRRDEFVAWAHRTGHKLLNPAGVVEWNTDKRYLAELAAAGVPVIPTTFISPDDLWIPPTVDGEYVIKPAISGGSLDTGRYGPTHQPEATDHIGRLQRGGRVAIVQPYLPAVDTYGETALLYFALDGRLVFSHAIRKGPMLDGPAAVVEGLYKPEEITPRVASAAELTVGDAVVAALPDGLLYARVDLIPDTDGIPLVIEVELTEPSLFFGHSEGAAERFAAAIVARLGQ